MTARAGVAFAKVGPPSSAAGDQGLRYSCKVREIQSVKVEMAAYLKSLGIPIEDVAIADRSARGVLVYTLSSPGTDTSTLDLGRSGPRGASAQTVSRLDAPQVDRVDPVSKKEIVLALLQRGRLTELKGADCSVEVLARHVALRQTIVAWATKLRWGWPDGGPAAWNGCCWNKGTPKPGIPLHEAIGDAFSNQGAYKIGCYTATKLVMVKGIIDYWMRARDVPGMADWIKDRLLSDGEPLVDVEPAIAWSFEPDFDPQDASKQGKIMSIVHDVAAKNFVPGDWVYLLNPDPASRTKVGFEGSSTIYLGGGRFSDYYADNNHSFSYLEKLDEVFQWRHGVFDLKRDIEKRRPLAEKELESLGKPPSRGGLVMSWRITPSLFGEAIRNMSATPSKVAPATPVSEEDLPAAREEPALSAESSPLGATSYD